MSYKAWVWCDLCSFRYYDQGEWKHRPDPTAMLITVPEGKRPDRVPCPICGKRGLLLVQPATT